MASEEESDAGETGLDPPPPPPEFPNGRRPSSGTDIGFEESTSVSEVAPSDAPAVDAPSDVPESSAIARGSTRGSARGSTLKRGSMGDEPDSRRRKTSSSMSILKARESTSLDGKPPRKQWGSGRASKGLDGLDLDNPEVKELLRRLKEAEESTSSSSGHAKLASPKPGEYHRGIKVDPKIPFINFLA